MQRWNTLPQLRWRYNISPRLLFAAGLVALFVAIPLGYIFFRAMTGGAEVWMRLLQTRIWKLLGNTLLLTAAVTFGATLVGVSMSFLTERTDLPVVSSAGCWQCRWRFPPTLEASCISPCFVHAEG